MLVPVKRAVLMSKAFGPLHLLARLATTAGTRSRTGTTAGKKAVGALAFACFVLEFGGSEGKARGRSEPGGGGPEVSLSSQQTGLKEPRGGRGRGGCCSSLPSLAAGAVR